MMMMREQRSNWKNESGIALVMVLMTMVICLGAIAAVYVAFNTQGNLSQTIPNTEIAMNKAEEGLVWARYSMAQGDTATAINNSTYNTPDGWTVTINADTTTLRSTATRGRYSKAVAWDCSTSSTPSTSFTGVDNSVLCDSDIETSGTGKINMNESSSTTPTKIHSNGNIVGLDIQNIGGGGTDNPAEITASGTAEVNFQNNNQGAQYSSGDEKIDFPILDLQALADTALSGNTINLSSSNNVLGDNSPKPSNISNGGEIVVINVGDATSISLQQNYTNSLFSGNNNNVVVFVGNGQDFTVNFEGGNLNKGHILSEGALNFNPQCHVNSQTGVIYTKSEAEPAVSLANATNVKIGSLVSKGKVLLNASLNYDGTTKYRDAWDELIEICDNNVPVNGGSTQTITFSNWHEVASGN